MGYLADVDESCWLPGPDGSSFNLVSEQASLDLSWAAALSKVRDESSTKWHAEAQSRPLTQLTIFSPVRVIETFLMHDGSRSSWAPSHNLGSDMTWDADASWDKFGPEYLIDVNDLDSDRIRFHRLVDDGRSESIAKILEMIDSFESFVLNGELIENESVMLNEWRSELESWRV